MKIGVPKALHGREAATLERNVAGLQRRRSRRKTQRRALWRRTAWASAAAAMRGRCAAEWRAWDAQHGSENDPVDAFAQTSCMSCLWWRTAVRTWSTLKCAPPMRPEHPAAGAGAVVRPG